MTAPCFMIIMGKSVLGKAGSGRILSATVHDYPEGREYSVDYPDDKNTIVAGYHTFRIPTKPWFKRNGQWYETLQTTSNTLSMPADPIHDMMDGKYAVRKADGEYAKLKITGYDSMTRRITIDVTQYE